MKNFPLLRLSLFLLLSLLLICEVLFQISHRIPPPIVASQQATPTIHIDLNEADNAQTADNVQSLAFSPDGREVAAMLCEETDQYRLAFFDSQTAHLRREWNSIGQTPSFAFSPHTPIIAIPGADFVRIFNLKTGVVLRELIYPRRQTSSTKLSAWFSPDGNLLAVLDWSASQIFVWDTNSGRSLWSQRAAPQEFFGLTFSPDSRLLASAGWGERRDKGLKIWDARNGHLKYSLQKPVPLDSPIIFSPNGQTLASSGDSCILQWNFTTGKNRRVAKTWGFYTVMGFARNGRDLISQDDSEVIVQDLQRNVISRHIKVPLGAHTVISPDGSRLASDIISQQGRSIEIAHLQTP